MSQQPLLAALGDHSHFRPVREGRVGSASVELRIGAFPSLLLAIREMCRDLSFDVCEMPLITYLVGREHGRAFTAIPVFPLRQMPHSQLVCARRIEPKQLERRRVGVRTYTATSGVWVRGLLASQWGVDCDAITWVTVDEEHIETYTPPTNVSERPGQDLQSLLLSGQIDAAVGVPSSANVGPVLPGGPEAERAWRQATGLYPINHTVVIRDDVLAARPRVAGELLELFEAARIASGADPGFAYGLPANEDTLAALIRFGREQHILERDWQPEDLFA